VIQGSYPVSDLDVIGGDNRLTAISYDQVLLFCKVIHLYIPHRHAIDIASAERRIAEVALNYLSPFESRPFEARSFEVRSGEARPAEVCLPEVRPAHVRPAEVRLVKIRPFEIRLAEVCLEEVRLAG